MTMTMTITVSVYMIMMFSKCYYRICYNEINTNNTENTDTDTDTEQHEYDTILLSLIDDEEDDVKESAPEKQENKLLGACRQ
mmetsp:Transcript_3372/g.3800  ORF Transcript_3372/g.3800 Transcript_3372/m.3800 type:complete len:82 (+) Transcript_3372:2-247(+)